MAQQQESRYLNLFTDFAFKWVFGMEQNKDILIDFINTVLEGEHCIVDLQYRNSERLGLVEEDRKVIFDLLCENDRGEKILVEMQQARQVYFKDRTLFYAASLIQEQGQKGAWDYQLKATYVIAILNFQIMSGPTWVHRISLMDESTNQVWSHQLKMVFIEASKSPSHFENCNTHLERWMFLLNHLHFLSEKPRVVQEHVFLQLFERCEIGKFPEAERVRYQNSLSEADRMEEALKFALQEGITQGISQGFSQGITEGLEREKVEVIEGMLANGLDWPLIERITHMDQQGFENLKAKYLSA